MKRNEINLLKHIINGSDYRYETALMDNDAPDGIYRPVAIVYRQRLMLFDYTATAEHYIRSKKITFKTLDATFISDSDILTNTISLTSLTVEQAQDIIDRNIYMFNKINSIAQENELIKQINSAV